jgi:hypothetical protein
VKDVLDAIGHTCAEYPSGAARRICAAASRLISSPPHSLSSCHASLFVER